MIHSRRDRVYFEYPEDESPRPMRGCLTDLLISVLLWTALISGGALCLHMLKVYRLA